MVEFCTCNQQTIFVGDKVTINERVFYRCCNCKLPISREEEEKCQLKNAQGVNIE